jgi:hypothetical protein
MAMLLTETEERQHNKDDHNEADEIDDTVHDRLQWQMRRGACAGSTTGRAEMFRGSRKRPL